MAYDPGTTELDFEGVFDSIKKGVKAVGGVVDKVTDATITKPSAMIGGLVGGKKGRALGEKLGGFTSTVTKLGVGAGAAGIAAPLAPVVAGAAIHDRMKRKSSRHSDDDSHASKHRKHGKRPNKPKKAENHDNAEAAKIAALLAKKLGGPLGQANKALKMADLQRQATYEHRKLMGNAAFRRKVLKLLAVAAAAGDQTCERTVRVIMAR